LGNLTSLYALPDIAFPYLWLAPALEFVAVIALAYRSGKSSRNFIWALLFFSIAPLLVPDLIAGGRRSITQRYLEPAYLGVYMAVAAMVAREINSRRAGWRALGYGTLAILLCVQAFSCREYYEGKFDIGRHKFEVQAARTLEAMDDPTLIMKTRHSDLLLAMAHQAPPNTKFIFVRGGQPLALPPSIERALFFDFQGQDTRAGQQRCGEGFEAVKLSRNLYVIERKGAGGPRPIVPSAGAPEADPELR
jgi:hypothetical protein